MKRLLIALSLFAMAHAAQAQFATGVTYTASHVLFETSPTYGGYQNPSGWVYGPTFSFQLEEGYDHVKFGFEGRVSVLRGSNNYGVNTVDYGYRMAFPVHHIKPYGSVLIGYIGAREGPTYTTFEAKVDFQLITGVDVPLAHHLELRAFEYDYGTIVGGGKDRRNQIASGLLATL